MRRHGAALFLTIICLVTLLGFAALAIDIGHFLAVKAQRQAAADAGSLAGTGLMAEDPDWTYDTVVDIATQYASINDLYNANVLVEIGEFRNGEFINVFYPETANAVRVIIDRDEDTFFASAIGFQKSNIHASAIAGRLFLKSACVVPIGLRSTDFGPVDTSISEANPDKDGPSHPENGLGFSPDEEVIVYIFGNGPRQQVHLTIDLPQFSGVAETNKILADIYGEDSCGMVALGDKVTLWNNGTGNQNFGEKLVDRMTDDNEENDTIVVPVLATDYYSRDELGRISGEVEIIDFVGVHLDEVREEQIIWSNNQNMTLKMIVGTVTYTLSSGEESDEYPPGFTVTVSELKLLN